MPTALHERLARCGQHGVGHAGDDGAANETVSSTAAAASSGGNKTPATASASAAIPASAETTVAIFDTSRSACDHCVDAQWPTAVGEVVKPRRVVDAFV